MGAAQRECPCGNNLYAVGLADAIGALIGHQNGIYGLAARCPHFRQLSFRTDGHLMLKSCHLHMGILNSQQNVFGVNICGKRHRKSIIDRSAISGSVSDGSRIIRGSDNVSPPKNQLYPDAVFFFVIIVIVFHHSCASFETI